MKTINVYLNLPKGTSNLPASFYFHHVNQEEFGQDEMFNFIDQETQLNGARSVILFRKADQEHQNTFFAFIKDNKQY